MRRRASPAIRTREQESTTGAKTTTSSEDYCSKVRRRSCGHRRKSWNGMLQFLTLLHVIACIFYIAGLYWRISLHTGEECQMTYSFPNFVRLSVQPSATPPTKLNRHYKLYKFVDGRDPRYQSLLHYSQPIHGTQQHCGANTTVVLYIPGHGGSYSQARSLGAHGTQWTNAQQDSRIGVRSLMAGEWSGKASRLDQFVYEVYALDFAEQGGAWHGRFLEAQSDFVAQVTEQLVNDCQVDQVFLVAHSMGGYVARLSLARHPHLQLLIENVVTLATPHANPLYAFDESVHAVHQRIQAPNRMDEQRTLWVSLSGGLRDEMIAPIACEMRGEHSYLASTVMATGSFGMDHRAIVWCHGVLEEVRRLIWELTRAKGSNFEERSMKVRDMLGRIMYEKDVQSLEARVSSYFGATKAFAMECAMLYNLPVVFGIHAILAALHCASVLCIPLIAVFFITSDLPVRTLLVLTLVTNSIHFLLVMVLSRTSSTSTSTKRPFLIKGFRVTISALGLLSLVAALTMTGWAVIDAVSAIVYASGIFVACILSGSFLDPPLAALIVLGIPGILAGTIVLAGWEQSIEARSWWLWIRLVLPLLAAVFPRLSASSSTSLSSLGNQGLPWLWPRLRIVLVIAVVVWSGQGILLRGHAHDVAPMVERLLVLEVVFGTLVQGV